MIVPSRIRRRFSLAEPDLGPVAETVRQSILGFCESRGYPYVGRKKTLESLAEKIETGRYSKWSEIDDLFACSVVIPTLREEEEVLEFLATSFVPTEIKRRGQTRKPPDTFRFDTTRFYGRLKPPDTDGSADARHQITFEVQVRSAFEHAWAVATHSLVYKSGGVSWKAERLAAQLKAAVEQLDTLVLGFGESSKPIIESEWPELAMKKGIIDRFSRLAKTGGILDTVVPKDWSRFADNVSRLIRASKKCPKYNPEKFVAEAIDKVEAEIRRLGPNGTPLSLSLFQVAFGVFAREGLLESLHRFCPLVTDELLEFYPATRLFEATCFKFDG